MILLLLLVVQDDPERAVREALPVVEKGSPEEAWRAVERLSLLGPAALPALRRAAESSPARRRLLAACEEIEADRDLREYYGRPVRLAVSAKDRRPSDLLREIAKSAGETIDLAELEDGGILNPVTLELKEATFLEAVDAVCRLADLRPNLLSGYYISRDAFPASPRFLFRNFLVRVATIEESRTLDFSGPPGRTWTVGLDLGWDSKVRPLAVRRVVELDEAVDDKGRNLIVAGGNVAPVRNLDEQIGRAYTPGLAPPSEGAKRIARLSGAFLLEFPKARRKFEFPKVAAGQQGVDSEFTVTVSSLLTNDEASWSGSLSVRGPWNQSVDPSRVRLQLRWKSDQGELAGEARFELREGDNAMFTFRFYRDEFTESKEATLLVEIVLEIAIKRVPFELRDIPVEK